MRMGNFVQNQWLNEKIEALMLDVSMFIPTISAGVGNVLV